MIEKKQLNAKQLEEVSGGVDWAEEMSEHLPSTHGKYIGMYEAEAYVGQDVYVVKDADSTFYYWGRLLKSYEKETGGWLCPTTSRIHVVSVSGACRGTGESVGTNKEFLGDNYTLFLYN